MLDLIHEETKKLLPLQAPAQAIARSSDTLTYGMQRPRDSERDSRSIKRLSRTPSLDTNKQEVPVQRRHRSIVSDLFQGSIQSAVTCSECSSVVKTTESFYDLSLGIPSVELVNQFRTANGQQQKRGLWGTIKSVTNFVGYAHA